MRIEGSEFGNIMRCGCDIAANAGSHSVIQPFEGEQDRPDARNLLMRCPNGGLPQRQGHPSLKGRGDTTCISFCEESFPRAGHPRLAEGERLRAAMAVSGHMPSLGPIGAIKNRNTTLSHWLILTCGAGWHMQRSSCHV